ncbi:hypothetical protein [Alicyclobacillus sp. SO9]|uniref:hypothetical protein n=1 Tax=Alicyclobacillus sp. SO9 TaxID=2665646 RepID=UPI0018E77AA5|nr:hypothetical protein [Alicyclobacillus sp. SO9]QQE79555.1 hypothetical protein GI364_03400 [Alicyclobacillus sp. SO9]
MKFGLLAMLYSLLMAVVMSLVFLTLGQLYIIRQDASAATTDAALTAAAAILQSGGTYVLDPTPAVNAGKTAYARVWQMQHLHGLTTVGPVKMTVDADHVSATGAVTFTPLPLWPLKKLFPQVNFDTVTLTRTGTANIHQPA